MASTSLTVPLEVTSGSASNFDLTPGAPTAQWQGGTTEPTLIRTRGFFVAQPRSAVTVTSGGVRETRYIAVLLAWRQQGTPTLDPMNSVDLSSEDIIYHGGFSFDTRDFIVETAGTPNEAMKVFVAGPGIAHWDIDVKSKRRVRSENDRLILSARAREYFTTGTPPNNAGNTDVSARLGWSLRFLYRAHR